MIKFRLLQLGADCCSLVPLSAISYRFVQLGADWCRFVQRGAELVQLSTVCCGLGQIDLHWLTSKISAVQTPTFKILAYFKILAF